MEDLKEIRSFLSCPTPEAWVRTALDNLHTLLIDHAHCEKKAASSAMSFIYHYPEHYELSQKMSRIIREEMRHFEQVLALMQRRNIPFKSIAPASYAGTMHKLCRNDRQGRLVDLLILGAFIEARSCERFAALVPHLEAIDTELATFYFGLLNSEARHFQVYLQFAESLAGESIQHRVELFAATERELILAHDSLFRFHSGIIAKTQPEISAPV